MKVLSYQEYICKVYLLAMLEERLNYLSILHKEHIKTFLSYKEAIKENPAKNEVLLRYSGYSVNKNITVLLGFYILC